VPFVPQYHDKDDDGRAWRWWCFGPGPAIAPSLHCSLGSLCSCFWFVFHRDGSKTLPCVTMGNYDLIKERSPLPSHVPRILCRKFCLGTTQMLHTFGFPPKKGTHTSIEPYGGTRPHKDPHPYTDRQTVGAIKCWPCLIQIWITRSVRR